MATEDIAPAAPAAAPMSARDPTRAERRAKWWADLKVDLKWMMAILFVVLLAFSGYLWGSWSGETAGEEDLEKVTKLIFSTDGLVVPFEILSVLLLAALIGGVVMAFRDPEGGD